MAKTKAAPSNPAPALFRVWAGIYAKPYQPDTELLDQAKRLTISGGIFTAQSIPYGVIDPRVRDNHDDGIHRNMYAIRDFQLSKAETEVIRQQLFKYSGGLCTYCDKKLNAYFPADHVWPAQHGGIHAISNRAATCLQCNFVADSQRTENVRHRRAYVRLRRNLTPDIQLRNSDFLSRIRHLHQDLL